MSITNILRLLIICIVIASIGIASAAPPGLPMGLYGDAKIGASPAPKDTKIEGKIGNTTVGTTYVVNSGKYGDNGNYLGISAPNEGDNVDLYVNGVFVTTVKYTAEKSTRLDLNAPEKSASGGTTSSGSGEGTGGVTPNTTASQPAVKSIQSTPGVTGTKEDTVAATTAASTSEPRFSFYTILAVFAVLVLIGVILKTSGKI